MSDGSDWSDLKEKAAWIYTSDKERELTSGFVEDICDLEPWGVPGPGRAKLTLKRIHIRSLEAGRTIKNSRDLRIEITDPRSNQDLEIFRDCTLITPIPTVPPNGLVDGHLEFECRTPSKR